MATIHKRRLVSGAVVWELTHGTGANRQRLAVGDTREQAQEALNQFNRQLALHGDAPSNDAVDAVLGRYLAFLQSGRRHSTFRRYARVLKTFTTCFLQVHHPGVDRLRQIKPAHIEEYKTKRLEGVLTEVEEDDAQQRDAELRQSVIASPIAPTYRENARFGWLGRKRFRPKVAERTVNYELQVLCTFFRWAVTRNYLVANPASIVERVRVVKQALPKFLTVEQLKQVFAICCERERRLFMAILLTGMRKGEIEHLLWSDVNFELGVILIQAKPQWNWKPKTDERVIPISPALRQILMAQYAERRNDALVFPNKEGNLDTHILPKLKKVGRKAGLPSITVHALRHSFGAHLRMAGVSLADIADLLGHKDLATTQIYAKVHQEHLRGVIAKLTPVVIDTTDPPPKSLPGDAAASQPTPVRRPRLKA